MPQIKYVDKIFLDIAKAYEKNKNQRVNSHIDISTGALNVKDIWDYYDSNRERFYDEILLLTGNKKKEIKSIQVFYNSTALAEHIALINAGRIAWVVDSIVANKQYIYEDFDWKAFLDSHINQKDCGMHILGEMINQDRKDIQKLINASKKAQIDMETVTEAYNRCRSDLKKALENNSSHIDKIEKLNEKNEELQKVVEELSEKLRCVGNFFNDVEMDVLRIEENQSDGIDSVVSDSVRNHSYLGEPDGETPSPDELNKRFGIAENKDEDKYEKLMWEDDE